MHRAASFSRLDCCLDDMGGLSREGLGGNFLQGSMCLIILLVVVVVVVDDVIYSYFSRSHWILLES